MTKIPAPIIAPMPSEVSPTGPSTRRSRPSSSAISLWSISIDLVAKSRLNITVRGWGVLGGWIQMRPEHSPEKIHRHAQNYQNQARPSVIRFHDQEVHHDC